MWIVGTALAIAIGGFVISAVLISLDYFKNNEERYEKFSDRNEEIKQGIYTKNEVDSIIRNFKDCVWYNGLSKCLK